MYYEADKLPRVITAHRLGHNVLLIKIMIPELEIIFLKFISFYHEDSGSDCDGEFMMNGVPRLL